MSAMTSAMSGPSSTDASDDRIVTIGKDCYGMISTGTLVNIHGDDTDKNRDIAHTVLAASLLAASLNPKPKNAIARYYRAIAKTLTEAAEALRQIMVAHGNCNEILEAL
jgi:hypothetical protein